MLNSMIIKALMKEEWNSNVRNETHRIIHARQVLCHGVTSSSIDLNWFYCKIAKRK